jgi:hypothetical protein
VKAPGRAGFFQALALAEAAKCCTLAVMPNRKSGALLTMVFFAATILAAFCGSVALSEAAVDADANIQGEVLGLGAPCVQFRMDNGETVSLEGASPQHFKSGMKFKLSGNWMRVSTCMQGRAFKVLHSDEIQ